MTGLAHVESSETLLALAAGLLAAGEDAAGCLDLGVAEAVEAASRVAAAAARAENGLETARQAESLRQAALEAAQHRLSAAEAAYSSCVSRSRDEEDGAPDCGGEAAEEAAAGEEATAAAVELEEAVRVRMTWEAARERIAQVAVTAGQTLARFQHAAATAGTDIRNRQESAGAFLRAQAARIDDYSAGGAPGGAAAGVGPVLPGPLPSTAGKARTAAPPLPALVRIGAGPRAFSLPSPAAFGAEVLPARGIIRPEHLAAAFRLPPARLAEYVRALAGSDARFRAEIGRRRTEWKAAGGPVDRAAVLTRVRRHSAGLLGERLVLAALAPLARTAFTQESALTPDGKVTVTDAVFQDLRLPVILGRGTGRLVSAGANLRVEVKARRKEAFAAELAHLRAQLSARGPGVHVLGIVTRDLHDLGEEGEAIIRDGVDGAAILAVLPRKQELDAACWQFVCAEEAS